MTEQDAKEINKVNNERILKILEEDIEKTNTFINQLKGKLEEEGTIEEKELTPEVEEPKKKDSGTKKSWKYGY